jgi:AcrR family transcriptional regulator
MSTMSTMTTTSRATTRAEQSARTRESIVEAATELFATRGFAATSLRDVATSAGLSHPGVLRHFASKDALLDAVVERFGSRRREELRREGLDEAAGLDEVVEVARRNAADPGYVALFSGLAGAATRPDHPAHDRLRAVHADIQARSTHSLALAVAAGEVAADLDVRAEALRLDAAWDGLQVVSLYLPGTDVPELLAYRLSTWRQAVSAAPRGTARPPSPAPDVVPLSTVFGASLRGYAPGRRNRAQIVADATDLFARHGYHGTSLRDVAERVGTGKSTLLHHFGSKEGLLAAVLEQRDAALTSSERPPESDAAATLASLPDAARRNQVDEPGLIELYAVLSTEAVADEHPAHAYFAERFRAGVGYFANVLERAATEGALRPGLDPAREATWLVGLWDGLQLRWLLEPGAVDVAAHLAGHVAWLLGRSAPHSNLPASRSTSST